MKIRTAQHLVIVSALIAASAMAGCASGRPDKKDLSPTEHARMLVEVANGALSDGDTIGALENLMAAEKLDDKLPELHHSEALAFYFKHDIERATAEARKAVQLKPDYSDANNTLGKLLMDQGRPNDAIPYLTKAAGDPLYRDAYKPLTNLGILKYRQGDYASAERYLSRAIDASPVLACVAHYYRGHILLRQARFEGAINDYDKAGRKFCAGFADAHLAMGIAYERSKQYDLARKKFLEIENRYPHTKVAAEAISHLRYLP